MRGGESNVQAAVPPLRALTRALLCALPLLAFPRPAWPCAACDCGDPTLTVMGTERPFAGRLRLAAELRHRTDEVGAGAQQVQLEEQRLNLGVSWSPLESLSLGLSLPLLRQDVQTRRGREVAARLGDLELGGRVYWLDSRRHQLSTALLLGLPTALTGAERAELQPGRGQWALLGGVSYGLFAQPWSLELSARGTLPLSHPHHVDPGPGLSASVYAQLALGLELALRAGLEGRLDTPARDHGREDPDSGGAILFAGTELAYSLAEDVLLTASLRAPVLNRLFGSHQEGPILGVGLVLDL